MNEMKIIRQSSKAKKLALDLFTNKQITRKVCRLFLEADYSDEEYVKKLTLLLEEVMRVKGYYRDINRIRLCDQLVDEWLTNINKEV